MFWPPSIERCSAIITFPLRVASSDGIVDVITLRVSMRQPAKEGGQLAVLRGPEDEAPVVPHQAVGEMAWGVRRALPRVGA